MSALTYADGSPVDPCPGCPEFRLDCPCVTDISQMPLADIKAVFADECIDHPTCTHVAAHPLSIVPEV